MEAVIGVGVVTGVWLLWRLLMVQEARVKVEAVRALSEAAAADGNAVERARASGRLVEFWRDVARATSTTDVKDRLERQDALRADLIAESWSRGVLSEFLTYEQFQDLHNGHPGPEPTAESFCSEHCKDYGEVGWMPSGLTECPFCGAPCDELSPDDQLAGDPSEREQWGAEIEAFDRLAKLFPVKAGNDRRETMEARGNGIQKRRTEYERRVAALRDQSVDVEI